MTQKINISMMEVSGTPDATKFLCGDGSWKVGGGGAADVQTFTASGTWTKPASGTIAIIELWGGGGSGCSAWAAYNSGGGGGGGNYARLIIPLSQLPATVAVTVGAGGAAVTGGVGLAGGRTSFGSYGYARGGGGGSQLSSGAGGNEANGNTTTPYVNMFGVSGGASFYPGSNICIPADEYGGGAGGPTASSSITAAFTPTSMMNATYGGAGGGSPNASTIPGGTSIYGGNGGAGAVSANGTAGSVRGGGGGGCGSYGATASPIYTSGAGGRGECIVTVI